MKKNRIGFWVLGLALVLFANDVAFAHVTPNVQLASVRDTVARLLPSGKLYAREVRLTGEQIDKLSSLDNWKGQTRDMEFKFFVSRDQNDRLARALVFMTEVTLHGPIVVAVALEADGKVAGAAVTDVQMEPLGWVGPLLRGDYMREFQGKTGSMELTLSPKWQNGNSEMTQGYALVIANAVKRSAQLFDVVFK